MTNTQREAVLRKRVRWCAWIIIIGLVLSGATAIPLASELDLLARWLGVQDLSPEQASSGFSKWILIVRGALHESYAKFPFLAYGTDWLAFGHFVIAIAFVGALRHPLRNSWMFTVGMIACVLVIPWALLFGELREIPIYWRLIDCSFGVFGFVPNWLAQRWTRELERLHVAALRLE
jgi:hypothetical protein